MLRLARTVVSFVELAIAADGRFGAQSHPASTFCLRCRSRLRPTDQTTSGGSWSDGAGEWHLKLVSKKSILRLFCHRSRTSRSRALVKIVGVIRFVLQDVDDLFGSDPLVLLSALRIDYFPGIID
jgi:hypothetical protein